jgi:hypothetical protein
VFYLSIPGATEAPVVTTETPKPVFYNRTVLPEEKVQVIRDFMNCNFQNFSEVIASPIARTFVFQLPNLGIISDISQIPKSKIEKA